MSSDTPNKPKKSVWGKILLVLLILVLLGGLGYVGKLYWDTQTKLKSLQENATSKVTDLTDAELKALIDQVGRHIVLPGDKPQVVTITNVDQLKIDQPFFNVAQNGDKLLVYTSKVILYRTSIDRVIDIAQIRNTSDSLVATPSATMTPEPTPAEVPTDIPQ